MGLGVAQFGQNLTSYIITVQNGLTEITPGTAELGGTLIKNTSINGNAFTYALQLVSTGLFRIFGQDKVGSNFPMWVDVDTTSQSYGSAAGDTLGRTYRMTRNITEYLDFGFDPAGLMYMTKVHDGSIIPLNSGACLRVDSLGRFAIGLNTATPLTTPTAYIHLAAGTATAGTAPLKLSSGVNLTAPEAGTFEFNGTDFFLTPAATRFVISFTDRAETFSAAKTFSVAPKFATGIGLNDANNIALVAFPATVASAVNFLQISNSATGVSPDISAMGANTNIGIAINTKGTGVINLVSNGTARIVIGTTVTFNGTSNIFSTLVTLSDVNMSFGTATGTKFGTATNQKLSFWNKTPIIQPTTGIAAAAFVGGGGANVTRTDTFGGYTLEQLAAVIINTGLAA